MDGRADERTDERTDGHRAWWIQYTPTQFRWMSYSLLLNTHDGEEYNVPNINFKLFISISENRETFFCLIMMAQSIRRRKHLTGGERIITVQHRQYHDCWCPGDVRRRAISAHVTDYID